MQEAQESKSDSIPTSSSTHFLPPHGQVLPIGGKCPGCQKLSRWIDIVKPLSYRLTNNVEGQKKRKLTKKIEEQKPKVVKRKRKGKGLEEEDEKVEEEKPKVVKRKRKGKEF